MFKKFKNFMSVSYRENKKHLIVIFEFMTNASSFLFPFFFHLCGNPLQRMDLGECPKVHDFGLRADYENASKEKDYYYDVEVSVLLFV